MPLTSQCGRLWDTYKSQSLAPNGIQFVGAYSTMKLFSIALLVCLLLGLALGHEQLFYGYGLNYAHSLVPLAYARLLAPATQSHVYHSVQTPSSFQQQYRSDYQPMTYEYVY